tara:strand:+ start:665 stop:1027 length:363 start_codon:yes stop_codon:yes gene_type:complete
MIGMNKNFWVGKDMYIEVLPDVETDGIRMIVHWSEQTKMIIIMKPFQARKVTSDMRAVNYTFVEMDEDDEEPIYCPFCGPGSDVSVESYKDEFQVACHDCGAGSGYHAKEEAIKSWNRRY